MPPKPAGRKRERTGTPADATKEATCGGRTPQNESTKDPRKGRRLDFHPSPSVNASRTLQYLGCEDAPAFRNGALDYGDYKLRLPYFPGRIFVVVRELELKGRQAMCHQTLPQFAQSQAAEPVMAKVEQAFEEAYPNCILLQISSSTANSGFDPLLALRLSTSHSLQDMPYMPVRIPCMHSL